MFSAVVAGEVIHVEDKYSPLGTMQSIGPMVLRAPGSTMPPSVCLLAAGQDIPCASHRSAGKQ